MVGGTVHSGLNTIDFMSAEKTGVAYLNRPTTILSEWMVFPSFTTYSMYSGTLS